ncbi:STAS domain-containing protein [Micromonospora psammae]|uniref:STAS domain-containing protein n=1 Tax=Micromonospora sp. CPCC 205556 TaxID=3122398 RepID=UPI002FF40030
MSANETSRTRAGRRSARGLDRLGEPITSLTLTSDGSAKLVTVSGEIDMSNAHLLTELVECVCRPPAPMIARDLFAVRFFSAHAVSALLQAQHIAATAGAAFLLRDPAPCVTYILATTGALASFRISRADGAPPRPRSTTVALVTPVRRTPDDGQPSWSPHHWPATTTPRAPGFSR